MEKIYKQPWIIVLITLFITAIAVIQLPKIETDNALDRFLSENHPSRIANNKMRDTFGDSELIVLAIKSDKTSFFTPENFRLLQELTEKLEKVRYVNSVNSVINTDFIKGTPDGMEVVPIADGIPENQKEMKRIIRRLKSWDTYKRFLYSDDMKATQIVMTLDDKKTVTNQSGKLITKDVSIDDAITAVTAIENIVKKTVPKNLTYHLAGMPTVNILISKNISKDMARLLPFVIIIVLITLFLSFRQIGGIVLPLTTVVISVIWTMGLMAYLGIKLTVMGSAIPILLVAVGSAYGIHIISHYYDNYREIARTHDIKEEEHIRIIKQTVTKIGKPVFLAGITTMAGFGSLGFSEIVMIRNFGLFTAFGVFAAFIISVFLIPSLLLIKHRRSVKKQTQTELPEILNKLINVFTDLVLKHTKKVSVMIIAAALLFAGAIPFIKIGLTQIKIFKPNTTIRRADNFINKNFSGTTSMHLIVRGKPISQNELDALSGHKSKDLSDNEFENEFSDADFDLNDDFGNDTKEVAVTEDDFSLGSDADEDFGNENITKTQNQTNEKILRKPVKTPELLYEFDRLGDYLKANHSNVGKISSLADMIKRMNHVMHADSPGYKEGKWNEIPHHPEKYGKTDTAGLYRLISQYLLLYSGSLDTFVDNPARPETARIMVTLNSGDPQVLSQVRKLLLTYAQKKIVPLGYEVETAGWADMQQAVDDLIINTQITSIFASFLFVIITLTISFRSIRAGLFGIIPLALSLLINFGVMGLFAIPLNTGTALVASVAIGISIDYAIHFISGYHYEYLKFKDSHEATKQTLKTAGKAIIFNAVSVAAGFLVLIFSSFSPLTYLGILTALTMTGASLISLTLLPILLNRFKPRFARD